MYARGLGQVNNDEKPRREENPKFEYRNSKQIRKLKTVMTKQRMVCPRITRTDANNRKRVNIKDLFALIRVICGQISFSPFVCIGVN